MILVVIDTRTGTQRTIMVPVKAAVPPVSPPPSSLTPASRSGSDRRSSTIAYALGFAVGSPVDAGYGSAAPANTPLEQWSWWRLCDEFVGAREASPADQS